MYPKLFTQCVRIVVVTRGSLDTICYGHECASFTYMYSVCEEAYTQAFSLVFWLLCTHRNSAAHVVLCKLTVSACLSCSFFYFPKSGCCPFWSSVLHCHSHKLEVHNILWVSYNNWLKTYQIIDHQRVPVEWWHRRRKDKADILTSSSHHRATSRGSGDQVAVFLTNLWSQTKVELSL